ncbi:MAG TPA: YdeI/OmpD-associated family protein [Candidatus Dormibacteraeota bacterium]|nr:YdeI/OmpD-associated family protein [Candidatus Dormibacteraeota bacterium]
MKPRFFATAAELRAWLEDNHTTATELFVGFYRRDSGKPSITWQELVDEELCFGWIDGVRKGIDDVSYSNRITPRKPRSTWSAINIARARELIKQGRMRPAGLKAFERRTDERSAIYSYEQRTNSKLDPEAERTFRANKKAWAFFESQPPSYRKTAIYWVISAKREETRQKRLATLISDSQHGRTVGPLSRPPRSSS